MSRQVAFHELEDRVAHLGIFADAAQVVADDGQVVFPRVDAFDAADLFDGPLLQSVAADGIAGVGGVDDNPAVVQYVNNPLQIQRVVVFVV